MDKRVIELVNEYRIKKRRQMWSGIWSAFLGLSLICICLYIFFFAWPTVV